jgi:hypothetical protein
MDNIEHGQRRVKQRKGRWGMARKKGRESDRETETVLADEPDARPTSSLREELRFLFLNSRDPQGRRWSLQRVAAEAASYGEEMSRAYVHALMTGKVQQTSLRKVQVLGMVFGVGSMGLIHPLEPQLQVNSSEEETETAVARNILQEIQKHTGIIEKALTNAKLQRAVLLLDGYQSEETLAQASRIIEELGEMEKHFLEQRDDGKSGRRRPAPER